MRLRSSNCSEQVAWVLVLLSSGYLFLRIGLDLFAS